MITEIILIVFAIVYYLFGFMFFITLLEPSDVIELVLSIIFAAIASIFASPIILGVYLGNKIKFKIYK